MSRRVLLLMPTTTYRASDFLRAAARLDVEVIVGSDHGQALEREAPGRTLALDFFRPGPSVERVVACGRERALDAVIGVDDETVELAALAAAALGLPANPVAAVRAARDKHRARELFRNAGLAGPWFRLIDLDAEPAREAAGVEYPCVLKPLFLSASRGVLRADDPASFVAAFRRIAALLARPDVQRRGAEAAGRIQVEGFIAGREVAVEGLLRSGELELLALFDKPDMPSGPTFEETIYVTPSRLPDDVQRSIEREALRACAALGLVEGPVHAELRVGDDGSPVVLEVAPRSIGGLCSRALRFGTGISLEELILRHALGERAGPPTRDGSAAGVMMIPTPAAGTLRAVHGVERARAVSGIEDVVISRPIGSELEPLPEGHRYLGFIFARGVAPGTVEAALREAHAQLAFDIDPGKQRR